MTTWASNSSKARIYVALVFLAAIPTLIQAIYKSTEAIYGANQPSQNYYWLILAVITVFTAPAFVFLPGVTSLVTIGDAFVISICMIYGTSEAIVANAVYMTCLTLLLRYRHGTSSTADRIIFNISAGVLNVRIYGLVYEFLNPTRSFDPQEILIPMLGIAITYFLSNSIFVATAISLSARTPILIVWKNYVTVSLDFLISACAAAIITAFVRYDKTLPLYVAPFVATIWAIQKVNRAKAVEAQQHLKEQEQLYLRTVESLALAVDAKDQTTYGHIRRVKAYSLGLAKLCGITDHNELMAIETGSLLHDIGKLAIDDYILNKPGRLSKEEFEKVKLHTSAGDEILQQIQFPFPVAKYVRCHHERWDGLGYPDGLKGEEIPLGARILSIADAFDAIRSSRPYKLSFATQDSIELLRSQAGTLYDPHLVQLFIEHIEEIDAAAEEATKDAPKLSFRKYFETVDRAISDASSAPSDLPSQFAKGDASQELVLLSEFCSSLGRQFELNDIFPILERRLARMLPFSTCAFFLDNGNDTVAVAYAGGKNSQLLKSIKLELGKGISGWVAAYKRAIMNTAPALDFQNSDARNNSFADSLVVPLVFEGNCIGTISLYSEAAQHFSQEHLDLLQTSATMIASLIPELQKQQREGREERLRDPVTKVYRAEYLAVVGTQMLSAAENGNSPLSLLSVQIVNLSQITNLYGMNAGDTIMRKIAENLRSELRETDILVRYGHEGFVALLPAVRGDQASRYARRLQHQIRTSASIQSLGRSFQINCQTAVASFPADGATIFALLQSSQHNLQEQAAHGVPQSADGNLLEFPRF